MKLKRKWLSFALLPAVVIPFAAVACQPKSKTENSGRGGDQNGDGDENSNLSEDLEHLKLLLDNLTYTGLSKDELQNLELSNQKVDDNFETKLKVLMSRYLSEELLIAKEFYDITADKKAGETKITYKYEDNVLSNSGVITVVNITPLSNSNKQKIDQWVNNAKTLKGTIKTWDRWKGAYTIRTIGKTKINGGIQSIDGRSRSYIGLNGFVIRGLKAKAENLGVGISSRIYLKKKLNAESITYVLSVNIGTEDNAKLITADATVKLVESDALDPVFDNIVHSITFIYKTKLTEEKFKEAAVNWEVKYTQTTNDADMEAKYGSNAELGLLIMYEDKSNLPLKGELGGGDKAAMKITKEKGSTWVKYDLTFHNEVTNTLKTTTVEIEVTRFAQ